MRLVPVYTQLILLIAWKASLVVFKFPNLSQTNCWDDDASTYVRGIYFETEFE